MSVFFPFFVLFVLSFTFSGVICDVVEAALSDSLLQLSETNGLVTFDSSIQSHILLCGITGSKTRVKPSGRQRVRKTQKTSQTAEENGEGIYSRLKHTGFPDGSFEDLRCFLEESPFGINPDSRSKVITGDDGYEDIDNLRLPEPLGLSNFKSPSSRQEYDEEIVSKPPSLTERMKNIICRKSGKEFMQALWSLSKEIEAGLAYINAQSLNDALCPGRPLESLTENPQCGSAIIEQSLNRNEGLDNFSVIERDFYKFLAIFMENNGFDNAAISVVTKSGDAIDDPILMCFLAGRETAENKLLSGVKLLSLALVNIVFVREYCRMRKFEDSLISDTCLHAEKILKIVTQEFEYYDKELMILELEIYLEKREWHFLNSFYFMHEGEIVKSLLIQADAIWALQDSYFKRSCCKEGRVDQRKAYDTSNKRVIESKGKKHSAPLLHVNHYSELTFENSAFQMIEPEISVASPYSTPVPSLKRSSDSEGVLVIQNANTELYDRLDPLPNSGASLVLADVEVHESYVQSEDSLQVAVKLKDGELSERYEGVLLEKKIKDDGEEYIAVDLNEEAVMKLDSPPPVPPSGRDLWLPLTTPEVLGKDNKDTQEVIDFVKTHLETNDDIDIFELFLFLSNDMKNKINNIKTRVMTRISRDYSLVKHKTATRVYADMCANEGQIRDVMKYKTDIREFAEKEFYDFLQDVMIRNQLGGEVISAVAKTSETQLDPLVFYILRDYITDTDGFFSGVDSFSFTFVNAVFLHVYFMKQYKIPDDLFIYQNHVLKLMGIVIDGLKYRRKEDMANELTVLIRRDAESLEMFYLANEGEVIRSLLMRSGSVWWLYKQI